jgi:hypothetical protein
MDLLKRSTRVAETRGGAVGWGTALQAGRSWVWFPMVSMQFLHWHNPSGLGSTQPLTEMSTRNIFWGSKDGRCVVLTTLPPSCVWLSWNLVGPVQACNGIAFYRSGYPLFVFCNSIYSCVSFSPPCSVAAPEIVDIQRRVKRKLSTIFTSQFGADSCVQL